MNVPIITGYNYNKQKIYNAPINLKTQSHISFNGLGFFKKVNADISDVFMPSLNKSDRVFNASISNIMQKIQTQVNQFTPQKLEEVVIETRKAHPDTSEKAILLVIQRLTQWAEYSSFEHLAKLLTGEEVSNVSINVNSDLLNRCYTYLIENKGIIGAERYNKNLGSFITDSNMHNYLSQSSNTKIINLEGFDKGVNFLTDNNLLASKTINVITEVKKLMNNNPNLFYEEALSEVLNGKIIKFAESKNLKVTTLSRHNLATRETILEQMSPCQPKSGDELKLLINTIVEHFVPNDRKKAVRLRNNIAKYFEDNIEIIPKQRILKALKDIKNNISQFAKENDIKDENIYLLIPRENKFANTKSFGVVTEMYKQLFNIPEEKILYNNNLMFSHKLPTKSAIVILDDVAISGESLKYSAGYDAYANKLRDDIHMIFAPVIGYEKGILEIQKTINKNKRQNRDTLFAPIQIEKKEKFNLRNLLLKLFFAKTKYGKETYGYSKGEPFFNEKFVILPYMAPDYNSKISTFLSNLFLPCNNAPRFLAIKNTHIYFNEINKNLVNSNK